MQVVLHVCQMARIKTSAVTTFVVNKKLVDGSLVVEDDALELCHEQLAVADGFRAASIKLGLKRETAHIEE